jgi:hypothetical protein
MTPGRPPEDEFPTLREDERDPGYDRLPVDAPEGPPPERERDEEQTEARPSTTRTPFETLREDERDPAFDELPVDYPDDPPPEKTHRA